MKVAEPPPLGVDARKHWAIQPSSWLGVFFALLAGLAVFASAHTALLRYPDRAIGVGLMGGVDPARRFSIYLTLIVVALGVWLAVHYGARVLRGFRPHWFVGVRSRLENELCATFAAVGSVALVARVADDQLDRLGPTLIALAALAGLIGVAITRRSLPHKSPWRRQLASLSTLAPLLFLPWAAARIGGALAGAGDGGSNGLAFATIGLLPTAYGVALFFRLRWPGPNSRERVRRAFVALAVPFLAFPTLCLVANEVQYTLSRRFSFEARSVSLVLLALTAIVSGLLFWQTQRGKVLLSPRRWFSRVAFPLIVFGANWLRVYQPELANRHVDPLHDGEQITAVQQLLSFGKWPFVDVWPAHGLFDYVGAVYSLVNGFHPLEITAWNGILTALSALATYAVLLNVSTPFFAFVAAMLLPIEALFPFPQYSFFYAEPALLGVGLLALWVLARPTPRRHALLSAAAFFCFFWTPTSGVASILAVLGLLVLACITGPERRAAVRGGAVFVATGAALFATYLLVLLMCGRPVLDTLSLIRAFMQADPLIGGRTEVIQNFDVYAFLQYVLLPGIGLLYLGKFARHALDRRPLDRVEQLLCFLTLASFVLFARTLTRHAIVEKYQPFFFPFLALAALFPRALAKKHESSSLRVERPLARAWFCAGLALYVVLIPVGAAPRLTFTAFPFRTWKTNEARFDGPPPSYPEMKAFLQSTLRPDDTFLELLNMPVLYALFGRELPGQFFLPTMFYATDHVQDSFLARFAAFGGSARVPVVLLPGKKSRGDIDNIENTLRSYRIAEYVYRDYVPFATLDGFDAWVSRLRWQQASGEIKPIALPFTEPSAQRLKSMQPTRLANGVLSLSSSSPDPMVDGSVHIEPLPLGGIAAHHAIRFRYRSSKAGKLELFYRFEGRKYNAADSGYMELEPGAPGEWKTGQVSIPAQPRAATLTGLRIDPPDNAELDLQGLELVFGDPLPGKPEKQNAGMLPFIWGNFDARLGTGGGNVLDAIPVPPEKAAGKTFDLPLRPLADKSAGNYLQLCLKLPEYRAGSSGARRTWKTVKHGDSWTRAGKLTLRYGTQPAATWDFDLVQPDRSAPGVPKELVRSFELECKRYLVRLSAQYAWSSQAVSTIHLDSSVPVVLEAANLLAGD
jgi:hypothetical protein